jgi:dipeptidyl aminopeptidase/acylaminoacyl peptidase
MTAQELEANLRKCNPIARIDVLAKAKVPVFIIHGDVDKVVPLEGNSAELAQALRGRRRGSSGRSRCGAGPRA